MFRSVWLYCTLMVAASWANPLRTTCQSFGGDTTVDPRDLIGNWTTVYSWSEPNANMTEIITVSELTDDQLLKYDDIFKNYPKDKLKLRMFIHAVPQSVITFLDIVSVMVPIDDQGNVEVWIVDIKTNTQQVQVPLWVKLDTKWKRSGEFLMMMVCIQNKSFVYATSSTPDEGKLQEVVSKVQFQGYNGARVYHT